MNLRVSFLGFFFLFSIYHQVFGQNFGEFASAVLLFNCNNSTYYNTTGGGANCINPNCSIQFNNQNLGSFNTNSLSLILNGGEIKSWKNNNANVCSARLNYVVYPQGNRPASPTFSVINLPFKCNCCGSVFCDNIGACGGNDQKWSLNNANIDLTARPAGNYSIEIYFDYTGDDNSSFNCPTTRYISNGGSNYIANFQLLTTGSNCSILLPITLGKTEFVCQSENSFFNWVTLSEQNTSHFILEGTYNGLDWETICEKKATGSSSVKTYYQCELSVPTFDYFRIVQFDLNGFSRVYGPFANECIHKNSLNITQSAGELDHFMLSTDSRLFCLINILDVNGRIIHSVTFEEDKGIHKIYFPENLSPGTYLTQLVSLSGEVFKSKRVVYLPK